jgi:ubiquinone/menaquinone biosynthesis C-methylase UbiE
MSQTRVNYDHIAASYHSRYGAGQWDSTGKALLALAHATGGGRVLEVGCGTGRWLAELAPAVEEVCGLDASRGMLREARLHAPRALLAGGSASRLPYPAASFDMVACVNALHHFDRSEDFIDQARRVLRHQGALAVVGMDRPASPDCWYIYRCFDRVYETDRARYPSAGMLVDGMVRAGFARVEWRVIERLRHSFAGRQVFDDPFLAKNSTSQLVLLSDEDYANGLARLHAAVAEAEALGETPVFTLDLPIMLVTGWLAGS